MKKYTATENLYPYTYTVTLQGDTYIAEYRDGAMYLPFPYGSATLERMTKYN